MDFRTDQNRISEHQTDSSEQRGFTIILDNRFPDPEERYQDTQIPAGNRMSGSPLNPVPEKIRKMRRLYEYGDGSFRQKCKIFYIQGKFMEDYEDDYPWRSDMHRYFTVYHDLNPEQLRGYFSWRTQIRRGNFQPISTSIAYLYIYELLNGIGAASVRESLQKMKEFETGYLDSGIGDAGMRRNIRRWMLDLAVLNGLKPEEALFCTDDEKFITDQSLEVLRDPEAYSDREVFDALCTLGSGRISSSAVMQKNENEGIRLFSSVWKTALSGYRQNGKDLFTACFGSAQKQRWYPLGNAVYYQRKKQEPVTYMLNACRTYICENSVWYEQSYQKLRFDRKKLDGLLHEADRRLRLYLKAGHPLQEKPEEAWAVPFIDETIEEDRKRKIEASRPKIQIRFSELGRIRSDAAQTRDRLLTEEERLPEPGQPPVFLTEVNCINEAAPEISGNNEHPFNSSGDIAEPADRSESADTDGKPVEISENAADTRGSTESSDNPVPVCPCLGISLDDVHLQILRSLLHGEDVKALIKKMHGIPEIVADTINTALFDEIGDTAVECENDTLILLEDYRDDLLSIFGGNL